MKFSILIALSLLAAPAVGDAQVLMDKSGLDVALQRGDAATVESLIAQGKVGKLTAAFSRAALAYDLASLPGTLAACRDAAFQGGAYGQAASCGIRLAGAEEALGDPSKFFDALAWLQLEGLPALRTAYPGKTLGLGDGLDAYDFSRIAKTVAPAKVEVGEGSVSLPVSKFVTGSGGWVPLVRIEINGHEMEAELDTGASSTLILGKKDAERLGLEPVVKDVGILQAGLLQGRDTRTNDGYAIARSFSLGPLHATNYLVTVTDRPLPHPFIGISTLARFKAFSIDASRLVLDPAAEGDCDLQQRVTFASSGKMQGAYVFPAVINGEEASATLDTGSDTAVVVAGEPARAFARLPLRQATGTLGGTRRNIPFRSANVALGLARHDIGSFAAKVLPLSTPGAEVYLGAPILDRYSVTLDVRASTLCFAKP